MANAREAPDLSDLVQIIHENGYVSIFLYHPDEDLIEEMYVSLDALRVYDFAAARIAAAALDDAAAIAAAGT